MPGPHESSRDSGAVARILATDATCVECIMSKTGLDLDRVLRAIGTLAALFRLTHTWGRCLSCLKKDRTLLTLDDSSRSQSWFALRYDAPEGHGGIPCSTCGKPIGLSGQRALLRRGKAYHTTCVEGASTTARADD